MAKKLKTGLGVCQVPPSRTYGPWGTSKLLALRVNFTLTCTTLAARQVACLQGLPANCLRCNIEYRLAIPTRSTHHRMMLRVCRSGNLPLKTLCEGKKRLVESIR